MAVGFSIAIRSSFRSLRFRPPCPVICRDVACLNTPSPQHAAIPEPVFAPVEENAPSTKQLPLSGEFTKRGKEVVNYGRNFLTFTAHGRLTPGRICVARKRRRDIPPKFI
ncbi:hypothetical protein [Agrobacterium sp. B1(2019)]|uniref:hypothetical protein n=1 Tax=Agrobacterium sp. B1(2019) TaxID=2607032 RepID=UPI00165949F2|nr:hypothetical protein [Agrobacterium sp. B1(2019)]